MKKGDLKSGMIVKLRNGKYYMVLENSYLGDEDIAIQCDGVNDGRLDWWNMKTITEDLLDTMGANQYDVIAVYQPTHFDLGAIMFSERKLLWKRSEKKKYTFAQLFERLGEEFEIVEGD